MDKFFKILKIMYTFSRQLHFIGKILKKCQTSGDYYIVMP